MNDILIIFYTLTSVKMSSKNILYNWGQMIKYILECLYFCCLSLQVMQVDSSVGFLSLRDRRRESEAWSHCWAAYDYSNPIKELIAVLCAVPHANEPESGYRNQQQILSHYMRKPSVPKHKPFVVANARCFSCGYHLCNTVHPDYIL